MVEKSKTITDRKIYWDNKKYENENARKVAAELYKKRDLASKP